MVRSPLELTTVTSSTATFHEGVTTTVLDGLAPASSFEHRGIDGTTLPRPSGALRCRIATVNDVHFGETEAGRLAGHELGPVQRVAPGETPYPELMNRAVVAELVAADAVRPIAAVIAKGDLTADGAAAEFAAFEDCYRSAFGPRLFAVRGNHDCYQGQTEYAGDQWIDLPGVAVVLLDTAVPGHTHGSVTPEQVEWLDALAAASDDPVIVMGHHPQYLGAVGDDPAFSLDPDASDALDAIFERRRSVVAYAAGHTHRHRVQRAGGGVPSIEVGCVKDFPGTWADYEVYDGAILQIVHRISSPEALTWSNRCRALYSDFGLDYASYALGRLSDRCFVIPYR